MKYKIKTYIHEISEYCKSNEKMVKMIVLALCTICILSLIKTIMYQKNFVKDSNGNVVAIYRDLSEASQLFTLNVTAEKEDEKIKEKIDLFFDDEENERNQESANKQSQDYLADAIMDAKDRAQQINSSLIVLPKAGSNGIIFSWHAGKDFKWLYFLFFIPVTIIFAYENSKSKVRKSRVYLEDSIKKYLPGFNSKILLLLQTGMVLSDCFIIACDGYKDSGKDDFPSVMCKMKEQYLASNSGIAGIFIEYSKKIKVREFSRLARAIEDNQYKGVGLDKRLESESELLWDMRKNNALEKGKLMETKLTFPLGALLIVLIIITAAPAVMQM